MKFANEKVFLQFIEKASPEVMKCLDIDLSGTPITSLPEGLRGKAKWW